MEISFNGSAHAAIKTLFKIGEFHLHFRSKINSQNFNFKIKIQNSGAGKFLQDQFIR